MQNKRNQNDQELKVDISQLEYEKRKLHKKLELKDEEILRLQKEQVRNNQEHKEAISQLKAQKEELYEKVKLKEKENLSLEKEKDEQIEVYKLDESKLKLDNRKLHKQLEEKEKEYLGLKEERDRNDQVYKDRISQLEADKRELIQNVEIDDKEILERKEQEHRRVISELEGDKDKLLQKVKMMENELKDLLEEKYRNEQEHKASIYQLRVDKHELRKKIESIKKQEPYQFNRSSKLRKSISLLDGSIIYKKIVTPEQVPRDVRIPVEILDYESYSKVQKVKITWKCNIDAQDNIAKSLKDGENKIADLFNGTKVNIQKGDYKEYMKTDRITCKQMLQKKMKNKNVTDCFFWIISSYSLNGDICNADMPDESISDLTSLNFKNFGGKLLHKPKILIFDLYEKPDKKSARGRTTPKFEIHKDWLIVFARNREGGSFIKTLKREIKDKSDKLDFVTILECVKSTGVDMKILYWMPKKLFLGDVKPKLETRLMSHYDINDAVRCCFFGSSEFITLDALPGIRGDRDLVHQMSVKACFEFDEYGLENVEQATNSFKLELAKTCRCHIFVFSSHGSSDGVKTQNGDAVFFSELIGAIHCRSTDHPIVLIFDCCRTPQYESTPEGEYKGNRTRRGKTTPDGQTFEEKTLQDKRSPEENPTQGKPASEENPTQREPTPVVKTTSVVYQREVKPIQSHGVRKKRTFSERLTLKDLIVVHAAVNGYASYMTENETASYFTKIMCDVIKAQIEKSDFVSMMECVNKRICESDHMNQTCVEIENQLTKKLFLYSMRKEIFV